MPLCKQCSAEFRVEQTDSEFLKKAATVVGDKTFPIPDPTLCPVCRQIRRLGFRNERHLYKRTCVLSGREILSMYSLDKPYRIYGLQEWWSDGWDPLEYGKDFDFSKPFFGQFAELQKEVPRLSFLQYQNENSEYTNLVSHLKNCYMIFSSDFNQDCQYGVWVEKSKNCTDCSNIDSCQLCYESIFSRNCYRCIAAVFSSNCSDSSFLFHCKGCTNCFLCSGLRQKKYCILNKQYSPEEYERKMKDFPLTSQKNLEAVFKQFSSVIKKAIHPYRWAEGRNENSSGDMITDTKDCSVCFETLNARDCRFIHGAIDLKDAMDGCYVGIGELGYENCECVPMPFHSAFTMNSYTGSNLLYCDLCMNNNEHCFGCVGLRHKKYCILNKQYSKEEYEALVPKIIEHMWKTKEWGEFFPLSMSPFGYNETIAQEFFPATETTARKNGWKWHVEAEEALPEETAGLPEDIRELSDSVTSVVAGCSECGKRFKLIPQEIKFYRDMGIALPARCFDCRHSRRMSIRNPAKLWTRKCSSCSTDLQSSYAPERAEKILCEECYLKTVY